MKVLNHGKQFGFYKKVHIKTYRLSKEKDILVTHCIARNEEFQFVYLTKTVLKSNVIFYMSKEFFLFCYAKYTYIPL